MLTLTFRTSPWSDPLGTHGPIVDSPLPAHTTHFDGEGGYLGVPDADDGFDEPFDFVGEPIPLPQLKTNRGQAAATFCDPFPPLYSTARIFYPKHLLSIEPTPF